MLFAIEVDLLLQAVDLELRAHVRASRAVVARASASASSIRPGQIGLDFATRLAHGFADLRSARRPRADSIVSASCGTCARTGPSPSAEVRRAASDIAAPCGLTLQRAALLLDLEHDVVDPREVLLRRSSFSFGDAGAPCIW
jgi:hypothetical protein